MNEVPKIPCCCVWCGNNSVGGNNQVVQSIDTASSLLWKDFLLFGWQMDDEEQILLYISDIVVSISSYSFFS
jgi:hypothetical protein